MKSALRIAPLVLLLAVSFLCGYLWGKMGSAKSAPTLEEECSQIVTDRANAWDKYRRTHSLKEGTPEWHAARARWRAEYKAEMADAYQRRGLDPPAWTRTD